MKLDWIFRLFEPIPTIIILIVSLPFLIIGLTDFHKAQLMVKSFESATGTVIDNEYRINPDPEDSAKVYRSYHPVVSFTTIQGNLYVFTDDVGSYPPDYAIGELVEVLYNSDDPRDATIYSWMSVWMGPLWVTVIGLLPILGLIGWGLFRYVKAERQFQAARQANLGWRS